MNTNSDKTVLSRRVRGLVQAYVEVKTRSKASHDGDAREAVCSGAFLRARSCKSREDFASFFIGTICSVPQLAAKTSDGYEQVALELLSEDDWQDVKALTMLALSGLAVP